MECYQYRDTVEYGKRYLCGPRIARKLTGKAAVALLGRPQGWLNRNDDVGTSPKFLRYRVIEADTPDFVYPMNEFIFRLRWRRKESMTEYVMRSRDTYIKRTAKQLLSLQRSGLDAGEHATVLATIRSKLSFYVFEDTLRSGWTEVDLHNREQS